MAKKKQKRDKSDLIKSHNTKRCWSCNTHMNLDVKRCISCNVRVGDVNEHGIAKRPVQWLNYLLTIAAIGGLVYFVWYSFLRVE